MPLIDRTYFDLELSLVGVNDDSIALAINMAIERYEPEYLDKVMGAAFAELFLQGLSASGGAFSSAFSSAFATGTISPRWKWLRDGKLFVLSDGRSIRWPGFQNARKQSAIAGYVYYWYRRMNATKTSQAGREFVSVSENGNNASPAVKMVRAWNEMVNQNRMLYSILTTGLNNGSVIYPEFSPRFLDSEVFHTQNALNF